MQGVARLNERLAMPNCSIRFCCTRPRSEEMDSTEFVVLYLRIIFPAALDRLHRVIRVEAHDPVLRQREISPLLVLIAGLRTLRVLLAP